MSRLTCSWPQSRKRTKTSRPRRITVGCQLDEITKAWFQAATRHRKICAPLLSKAFPSELDLRNPIVSVRQSVSSARSGRNDRIHASSPALNVTPFEKRVILAHRRPHPLCLCPGIRSLLADRQAFRSLRVVETRRAPAALAPRPWRASAFATPLSAYAELPHLITFGSECYVCSIPSQA